jgi:ABC-2 type transport system permease protein
VIADVRTIADKELREILTVRGAKGKLTLRTLAIPVLFGIVFGLQVGRSGGGLGVFFVGVMAMTTSLALVSDTIAGERERHTLETLLASPVSDTAILQGKLAAVVGYAWGVALVELAVIEVTSAAVGHALSAVSLVLVVFLSLLDAVLASGFGVQFSLRAPTVRAAARRLGQLSFVVVLPVSAVNILAVSNRDDAWYPALLVGAFAVLIAADVALLALARARFRRGRLLLD